MCRLFETIRVEDRSLCNIAAHNERFNRSRKELFGVNKFIDLSDIIEIPGDLDYGVFKCKVIYNQSIISIDFQPYRRKIINSLQLVHGDHIDYRYKFLDRSAVDKLLKSAHADEILIVKDRKLTDTSFSNVILFDGKRWITPANCLLEGTCRATLLKSGIIISQEIKLEDISHFKYIKLINAMNDMDNSPLIPVKNITNVL